jgi:hypothetical protein
MVVEKYYNKIIFFYSIFRHLAKQRLMQALQLTHLLDWIISTFLSVALNLYTSRGQTSRQTLHPMHFSRSNLRSPYV